MPDFFLKIIEKIRSANSCVQCKRNKIFTEYIKYNLIPLGFPLKYTWASKQLYFVHSP